MRIVTLNANGIRSAAAKGAFQWLARQDADVICLQETKAQAHQLDGHPIDIPGYHRFFHDAKRPGYSGVALYAKRKPHALARGFGVREFDDEGRYLEARFGDLSVVSLYLPSGSSGPQRQASKFRFLDAFLPHLAALKRKRRQFILCGDWNIAHKPIDLRNWKSNQKNSGFLPEERAWMSKLLDQAGFVDVYRLLQPDTMGEAYTWWSNRGQAWAKNVGWRLDYHLATPAIAALARSEHIYKEQRFSDHAPITIDYDLTI